MTLVNLPLLFMIYVFAVCGVYGLVGLGIRFAGRKRDRPTVDRIGQSVALASGCLFLTYSGAVTVWVSLYNGANSFGSMVGTNLVLSSYLLLVMPLLVGLILYTQGDIRQYVHRSVGLSVAVVALVLSAIHALTYVIY